VETGGDAILSIFESPKCPHRKGECQAVVAKAPQGIMRHSLIFANIMPLCPAPNSSKVSAALENIRRIVLKSRELGEEVLADTVGPCRKVGVIGAGIMGAAIAREYTVRGIPVVLLDSSEESLRRAARSQSGPNLALIRYTTSHADIANCDLVIESIAEKRQVKQALYQQLEPYLAKGAVLATNTSTIPITRLASGLASPTTFCGMHFCHPVRSRPIVEIIPGAATDTYTLATIVRHTLMLDRLPLLAADGPGFIVNRLLMAYLNAALDLLATGVAPAAIDTALLEFGMPMGPLRQLDEIGLDTALHSGIVLSEVSDHRTIGTELLVALVKAKQFGMKSGAGIFSYPTRVPNPTLEAFIDSRGGGEPSGGKSIHAGEITSCLFSSMVAEARRIIDEGKASAWQIDIASVFGLGFPCWRGGLHWWNENDFPT
jgi:3-hydroxyacyl-CoA dehydrogenase